MMQNASLKMHWSLKNFILKIQDVGRPIGLRFTDPICVMRYRNILRRRHVYIGLHISFRITDCLWAAKDNVGSKIAHHACRSSRHLGRVRHAFAGSRNDIQKRGKTISVCFNFFGTKITSNPLGPSGRFLPHFCKIANVNVDRLLRYGPQMVLTDL